MEDKPQQTLTKTVNELHNIYKDDELQQARQQLDELYKQVGQMKVETDGLKKVTVMPDKQRRKLVDAHDDRLSLAGQCRLLNLHRSMYYYKPKGISECTHATRIEYIEYIKSLKVVKIWMDGRGRATDNAYIERFFRSIKYEKLYLHEPKDGKELFELCKTYISFYNDQRGHSSIGDVPPARVYRTTA